MHNLECSDNWLINCYTDNHNKYLILTLLTPTPIISCLYIFNIHPTISTKLSKTWIPSFLNSRFERHNNFTCNFTSSVINTSQHVSYIIKSNKFIYWHITVWDKNVWVLVSNFVAVHFNKITNFAQSRNFTKQFSDTIV